VIDGAVVGVAPLEGPVFVEAGEHSVEARLAGKRAKVEVKAAMGAEVPISLVLVAPAAPPKAGPAKPPPPLPPVPEPSPERSLVPLVILGRRAR